MLKNPRYILLEVFLLLAGLIYYFYFLNKGIIFFDEGYFVHSAERIYHGDIPYKDLTLQYSPGYFYLLAFLYTLFGPSIIVGRYLSMTICLLIIAVVFLILNKLKVKSSVMILLSFLTIIAYGYPHINIPNVIWASVLLTLVTTLLYIHWSIATKKRQTVYLMLIGTSLALSLFLKQNIGLLSIIVFNVLLVVSLRGVHQTKQSHKMASHIVLLNLTIALLTLSWVYYFFLRNNISGLREFIQFSQQFAATMAFTLPPLTNIFQPLGIFKLLPYYTPIAFALWLNFYSKQMIPSPSRERVRVRGMQLSFGLISLTCFFTSIFPQSDLLHVYPYVGLVLVSILTFGYKNKLILAFIILNIAIGFYLTFFKINYYTHRYSEYDTPLTLPKAQNILLIKREAVPIERVYRFIQSHTKKGDYIFVYPTEPMFYFLFDRRNPTRDAIYHTRSWHFDSEQKIIQDIKQKKVKYLIGVGGYKIDTDLSRFIQKQKKVFKAEWITVYIINSNTRVAFDAIEARNPKQ